MERRGHFDRFWALLNRECLPALEAVRRNCPTREEFRTVESISSDFNITKHQSTYRIMTSTLPYNEIILRYRDGDTTTVAAGAVQTPLYRPCNGPSALRFWM